MENFCQKGIIEVKDVYDVCRGEDWRVLPAGRLRYDLTLIYPRRIKRRIPRTFGHYHNEDKPELFEVMSGQAWFFIQKYEGEPAIIKEAYLIEAAEKEKIIVPPYFSITTINPKKNQELIVSNWVSEDIKNDYQAFKKLKGPCYLPAENGFEKNNNYKEIPDLIKLKPKKLPAELENLEFLIHPEKYKNILTIKNLYDRI